MQQPEKIGRGYRRDLDAGPALQPEIDSFELSLCAERKADKTVKTYTEAAQWFAAGHLRPAGVTAWDDVTAKQALIAGSARAALSRLPQLRDHTAGGGARHPTIVQERSARVLNAAHRLAVIPKAFHQPLVDFSDDAQILATVEREMEEELLGRPELDSTYQEQRSADPMHITRLSEPMRWLIEHSDVRTWRTECVAFGINAMSGNFECACLIIIDDERWWDLYGGAVEANWEAEGLRLYSSRDKGLLTALISDPRWSNEGLFAFLQGIRRLGQIGEERVALPSIELEF